MKKTRVIKETASGGSVGAGAIGASPSRLGDMRKRGSLKGYLLNFYKKTQNKLVLKPVHMPVIKEYYDLSDVVSRLKGVESFDVKQENTVTFGVEDDEGNVMKVSVKKDQAKDFEYRLARDLADTKENNMSGAKKMSLAELLYTLKGEFDIVDAEFPKIPKDVIYNADKATKASDTMGMEENDDVDDPMDMNQGPDAGQDDTGGLGGTGDDMNLDDTGETNPNDEDNDGLDDSAEEGGDEGSEEEGDDASVEDFQEDDQPATPESLLQSVMDMLKKDAEARTAEAQAAAEESRARQAEYAYKSSQATVAHEEEYAQMEADMESQKQKEKQAKKLANLAKHRVRQTSTMTESVLDQVILEIDDFDTVQSLMKSKRDLQQKYRIMPTDTPDAAAYKKAMLVASMKELDDRMKQVRTRDAYTAAQNRQNTMTQSRAKNQEIADVKTAQRM